MWNGSCWGTSPGPGQVPVCHRRQNLEPGLTNTAGEQKAEGWWLPKEKRAACTLPRVAREAVGLQEPLIQGLLGLEWLWGCGVPGEEVPAATHPPQGLVILDW